ncbi:hypothetical protein [Geodermatophilus obscurus]|uniref:imine reductase family protein n=1 Tax=Geodermatophilus obscurus TaxID=1861 RepID=UPI003C7C0821
MSASLTPRAPRVRSTSRSHGFDVDECRHPGDEDNLAMEAAALDQMVSAAADSGTDNRLAGVMRGLAPVVRRGAPLRTPPGPASPCSAWGDQIRPQHGQACPLGVMIGSNVGPLPRPCRCRPVQPWSCPWC